MSVNKVILLGNVGKDPEVKEVGSNSVAKFSLATNETYTNKNGEKVKNTEWHNIVFWGKVAEIIGKYVKKGDMLYVEGKIETRKHEDKYYTNIKGDKFSFVSSSSSEKPVSENDAIESKDEDDLPF